ncbi:nucleotidyltransferase domain-containing protein [Cronobacter muytjensii]
MAAIKQEMEAAFPVVSKIDFAIGSVAGVLAPDNLDSWSYWLKHHCRCLYGEDLSQRFARFRPSRTIAQAVNGDVVAVINADIAALSGQPDEKRRIPFQRAAARKRIRATNLLRADDDTDWPDTLEDYLALFAKKYPSKVHELNDVLRESRTPGDAPDKFIARTQRFMAWFRHQLAEQKSAPEAGLARGVTPPFSCAVLPRYRTDHHTLARGSSLKRVV